MRLLIISIFLVFSSISFGQIVFEKLKHDFGDLESYDNRFVDIVVTNKGSKKEYLLSVKKPMDVVYLVNGQFIKKDSSLIVRLQINPKVKGRFSYEIEIYTSDKDLPTKIKLTGNLKDLSQENTSSFTSCPDFSKQPGDEKTNQFDLTVITIDKQTKEELEKSTVTMIQNGHPIWVLTTDKNGKIKEEATMGFSYFYASHDLYFPSELGAYVNFQRNSIVIELDKNPAIDLPVPVISDPIADIHPPVEEEVIIPIEEQIAEQLNNEEPSVQTLEIPKELAELDKNNFSEEYFKPVNVVFVLDVSSSMNQGEKLELMKYSLFQLVDMLREQDKMAIVTYATETQVLLPPTSGANKERINEEVTKLKASGMTAGGAGIKLGYKQALKGFLPDGVNQIIVITDGAFNRNSDDYKKYIKKYSKKGIQMSVVGVKNKDVDEQEMKDAAELGGGHYIPIFKLLDAQNNLKEEIRLNAFRKK